MGNVTPKQAEALRMANERGWFEVPRDATLGEIADELGISTQAASDRMRRGMRNITEPSPTGEMGDELLWCTECRTSLWTIRADGLAHLACRCVAQGEIGAVRANELAQLPERWLFVPREDDDE